MLYERTSDQQIREAVTRSDTLVFGSSGLSKPAPKYTIPQDEDLLTRSACSCPYSYVGSSPRQRRPPCMRETASSSIPFRCLQA